MKENLISNIKELENLTDLNIEAVIDGKIIKFGSAAHIIIPKKYNNKNVRIFIFNKKYQNDK